MGRAAIMVDVDGVIITHPEPAGWAVNLTRDLGISVTDLQDLLFKLHWDDVVHGRAALRDRLVPVLMELTPQVTYEGFIAYWFSNDAYLNASLLG